MSSYRTLLEEGKRYLRERQILDADLDAWYLLEYLIEKDRSWYFLHMNEEVSGKVEADYGKLLDRRGGHEPLQQITGRAWFMGLPFYVNKHVLIPRQDTEILVEEAVKRLEKKSKILDLCTGSGCILLSLLYNGSEAEGVGVDISPQALEVARKNGEVLGIPAEFVESDLFAGVEGNFQMIVSNPPYIPSQVIEGLMEEVRDYEPRLALDGGRDGLDFYRSIVKESRGHLYPGGWLIMEIGQEQGEAVSVLMKEEDYEEIEVVRDLAGLDRVVLGKKRQEEIHV